MGFTIQYESTRPVDEPLARQIEARCEALCEGRIWVSCEPVFLSADHLRGGHICGGSKPNLHPQPDDIQTVQESGLPDGTFGDLIEVLCTLSSEFKIDWNLGHDFDSEVGSIQNGTPDRELVTLVESFSEAENLLGQMPSPESRLKDRLVHTDDDEDDDGPNILRFPGVN
jgi:hypothetical protein